MFAFPAGLTCKVMHLGEACSEHLYDYPVKEGSLWHVDYFELKAIKTLRAQEKHAWGWCTGMIWRDDVGWVVGGGFMFGSSCTPVADSCQCMPKPIQYCKVK